MLQQSCTYTDTRGSRRSHRGQNPPVQRITESEQQPGEDQKEQQCSQDQVTPERPSTGRELPHSDDGTVVDLDQQYAGQHVEWPGADNTNGIEFDNAMVEFSNYPATIGPNDDHLISPMTTPTTNHFSNVGLLENPSAQSMFQFIPSQMGESVPSSNPTTGPVSPIAPLPTPASLNLKPYGATADGEVDASAEFHGHQTTPKTPRPSTSVPNGQGCSCLQRVVLLIDEFESQLLAGSGESISCLDSALASHKEAVRYGESMLACQLCSSRVENMTILSFLTERLAFLCERIVAAYMEQVASAPVASDRRAEGTRQRMGSMGKGNDAVVPARHDLAHEPIFLGEYEVDQPSEWNVLLGHIITVQLAALNSLVGSTKASSHTRWRSVSTENKIKDLLERLRQFNVPYSRC